MKILSNKECAQQVSLDVDKKRRKIAEMHLDELICDICQSVGISRDRYPAEKDLLLAILKRPEAGLNGCWRKCMMYDTSYSLIKKLGIRVSAKYQWLTNIKEHTTN